MLSAKPWKPEAVLRLGFGIFICVLFGAGLAGLARSWFSGGGEYPLVRILAGAVGFHGAALALVVLFLREHTIGWRDAFGWPNHPQRAVLLGAGVTCLFMPAGLALLAAIMKLLAYFGWSPQEQTAVQILRQSEGWPTQALLAFVAVVLAPIAEEVLFRGILYPTVKQAGFPRTACWTSSLLFALIHFHLPSFLSLLALALVLVWLYEKTDNLLAPIAAHSLFNALNFAILHLAGRSDP